MTVPLSLSFAASENRAHIVSSVSHLCLTASEKNMFSISLFHCPREECTYRTEGVMFSTSHFSLYRAAFKVAEKRDTCSTECALCLIFRSETEHYSLTCFNVAECCRVLQCVSASQHLITNLSLSQKKSTCYILFMTVPFPPAFAASEKRVRMLSCVSPLSRCLAVIERREYVLYLIYHPISEHCNSRSL